MSFYDVIPAHLCWKSTETKIISNLLSVQFRMLVYEYIDNGNLEQWLHGDVGPSSPLTWEIRMNIIIGTAKGYVSNFCAAYCALTLTYIMFD